MSQHHNRLKSQLNRFLNSTTTTATAPDFQHEDQLRSSSQRNAISSLSSITTAALSIIKSQVNPIMDPSTTTTSTLNTQFPDQESLQAFRVDRKLFEKLNKLSEKILKYCNSERMNLVNSPPYIIDILPDINLCLNVIQATYDTKLHILNEIEYFLVASRNLLDKLHKIIDLFKTAGKRMYDERSDERARLTKYTLILSHLLAELKSLFPKDVYEGQQFRIAKQDAADFWRANFKERTVVSWPEFERKLNHVHKIANPTEAVKLRETIQLTESHHVSIFEFDIFTRLFQPWNNLLNNWKFLATEHPAYSAFSTYDEVHRRLQLYIQKPGSYLFRLSCTKLGQWAIGYVTSDHKILQTIPQSLVQALIDGHKQNLYVYPNGNDTPIDISSAIAVTSASRIQCSREQHDMYCDMGTSFQVCKICSENNKDRKLEPCGHLICAKCLENWQEHNNLPSCPFCRCEIKTFEPIIISPFLDLSGEIKSLEQPKPGCSYLNDAEVTDIDEYVQPTVQIKSSTSSSSDSLNRVSANTDAEEQTSDDSLNHKILTESLISAFNSKSINSQDQLILNSRTCPSNIAKIEPPVCPPPLPPPPLPKPVSLVSSSSHHQVIVRPIETSKTNLISIKIEINSVLEHLVSNYAFDKYKVACALLITNNDVKAALEILQKYKNLR